MFKINTNFINNINNKKMQNSPEQSFTSNPANVQIQSLPNTQPDFAVKTPLAYQKSDDLNLPYEIKAHCYKLANGQKVIIVPKDGETVVKTYVNSGSMNEPDKVRGISHYIEHNLFNGSNGLEEGDFFKVVDKIGASTNASTGFAETNYYVSSNLLNKEDLENKIKIHASMLETPLFKTEKLEKEKGIVNSEINMILSRPENIAMNKTFKNLYNIKSTSADMIGGSTDNITNLTREDVVDYYNKNYYPGNMVTVISGEVDPEETMKLISKHFSSKRQPPASVVNEELKPIEKTVREDIISDKATATSIILGFNGPANNSAKEQIHTEALMNILTMNSTSRINSKIKQFNTNAWGESEKISTKPNDGRAILFSVDTSENNSEKVLKTMFEEIGNIQINPPTDEEMQIIKKAMLKQFSSAFEFSFAINDIIGKALLDNNLKELNNYEQIINSMTASDLQVMAKKYLDLNKTAVTVVHPNSTNANTINANYNSAKQVSFTGAQAPSKTALNVDHVREYVMPNNNFKILMNDIKTRNSYMNITFSDDIPIQAKPVAVAILDGLLNEGSMFKNEQEFSKELAKKGIASNFNSNDSSIVANSSFDADDLEQTLKTTKEVLLNPRFTDDSFNQVKNDIKEFIMKSEKSADRNIDTELYKGLLRGYSNKEILESLDAVTMDEIKELYNNLMTNAEAQITVSAPFSKKPELKNILFNEVSGFNPVKKSAPFIYDNFKQITETKVITETDNKNQAEIVQGYRFKTNGNLKDETSLQLLNIILGGNASSRLFNDLREKQKLAYNVGSKISFADTNGILKLQIKTTTENNETGEVSYDNVQKCLNGFKNHIEKLGKEKVSEEELNNAKLNLKNSILSETESNMGKTGIISSGGQGMYGISAINKQLELIDQITSDDLHNAANYIFKEKPTYSIVATENTLKNNEEFLNSLKKN